MHTAVDYTLLGTLTILLPDSTDNAARTNLIPGTRYADCRGVRTNPISKLT